MSRCITSSTIFLLLLAAVLLADVAGVSAQPSTTPCGQSKAFTVPAALTAGGTLKLTVPVGSVTVQAVQGSAWGIVAYSSSALDTYALTFDAVPNNVASATFANTATTSPSATTTSPAGTTTAPGGTTTAPGGTTTVPGGTTTTPSGTTTAPGGSTTPAATTTKPASSSSSTLKIGISSALLCLLVTLLATNGRPRGDRALGLFTILVACVALVTCVTPVYYWCSGVTVVVTYPPGAQVFVNGLRVPTCHTANPAGSAAVQQPTVYGNAGGLGTFWISSPIVVDLDQDPTCTSNCNEVIVCSSTCYVLNATLKQIPQNPALTLPNRVYSHPVLADIDANGKLDLCAAGQRTIKCWEWNSASKTFLIKAGWPKDLATLSPGITSGEIRGMAAADVDRDGKIEIFVHTTNSAIQVFAFKPDGSTLSGWPRYNTAAGTLEDGNPSLGASAPVARNQMGHHRYGGYGLNLGIGNMDDDLDLEIVSTYDNHQLQVFKKNGVAVNCAAPYTNPRNIQNSRNQPLTYGQCVYNRITNKTTDEIFLTTRTGGCFPIPYPASGDPCTPSASPCVPQGDAWMQFTQSPPSVMDITGDGKAEILSLPNSELGGAASCSPPYITQQRVLFVIGGAHGNGGDATSTASATACKRTPGFDAEWPPGGTTIACKGCQANPNPCDGYSCRTGTYYPVEAVPSIAFGDVVGDGKPEAVFSFNDGKVVCYDGTGAKKWSFDYEAMAGANIQNKAFEPSEPVLADLNGDGKSEVIFSCYGYPDATLNNQRLVILNGQDGTLLYNLDVKAVGTYSLNGNGNGAAGAPTVADIDGDGDLEIMVHTFDGNN